MMHRPPSLERSSPRRGMVLLAVLLVVVLLTLAAYQYVELMTAEYRAVDSYRRSVQARACAESGVHYAAALLAADPNGNYFDDGDTFASVLVHQSDITRFQGRFSVLSPLGPDETGAGTGFRYGVTDEAGKININALLALDSSGKIAHDLLIGLPNMTEETVNAILDWMDPDDTERPSGAEQTYYSTQQPAYRCKNGPLDTLEELLFVKGVTPLLLFGNDRNRNGRIDPDEEEDGASAVDQGWSAYLTVHGREQNVDAVGQPRIYVNDADLNATWDKLTTVLGEDLANFIIAYRVYGPASGSGGSGSSTTSGQLSRSSINTQNARPRAIASLYELITAQVSVPSSVPKQPAKRYSSPLNDRGLQRTLLPLLLDTVTTVRDTEIPGRINVNTAPQAVLAALPGLTDADVTTILARRPAGGYSEDPIYQSPAWLLTEANLRPNTLRTLERYITARSQVYRVQVVGWFDGGGPQARIEAVIDTNNGMPRILYWRDLTELGRAFDLSSSPMGAN